jgi:hypothetical protein
MPAAVVGDGAVVACCRVVNSQGPIKSGAIVEAVEDVVPPKESEDDAGLVFFVLVRPVVLRVELVSLVLVGPIVGSSNTTGGRVIEEMSDTGAVGVGANGGSRPVDKKAGNDTADKAGNTTDDAVDSGEALDEVIDAEEAPEGIVGLDDDVVVAVGTAVDAARIARNGPKY